MALNERRKVNLKFCLADFVYLIQEQCGNFIIKLSIRENYDAFRSASESNSRICQAEL